MATKLKDLLTEVFEENEKPIDKHAVIEAVSQYGNIGKSIYSSFLGLRSIGNF